MLLEEEQQQNRLNFYHKANNIKELGIWKRVIFGIY
jgi:hypothetical protein